MSSSETKKTEPKKRKSGSSAAAKLLKRGPAAKKKKVAEPLPVLDSADAKLLLELQACADGELPPVAIQKQLVVKNIKQLQPILKHLTLPVSGTKDKLLALLYARKKLNSEEVTAFHAKHFTKNDALADHFKQSSEVEEGFKAAAIRNASLLFRLWPEVVASADQMKKVKGVGAGMMRRLDEYFDNLAGGGGGGEEKEEETKASAEAAKAAAAAASPVDADVSATLKSAEGEPVGVELLVASTGKTEELVRAALKRLSANGSVYSPFDDHYASVE